MTIREIGPLSLLTYSEKVNFNSMAKHVRVKARDLYGAAHGAGLEITGPLYWIYHGADGNPDTLFLLDIGLPVTPSENAGPDFIIKRYDSFRCASIVHGGSWAEFPKVYGKLLSEIQLAGLELTGENREIYLNMDFTDEKHNITEIQIGIRNQ
ncbi:MAG TPA: GyrI-like domain-containing protein [Chitinophagaceae bacterium]|nr:GyrI-like domain-containing protein [Chitinophagaceae bacterium]